MKTATIEKMTIEQLRQFIDEHIDQRLVDILGKFELEEEALFADEEPDTQTWEEVKQDIERNRWTTPADAKSSLKLLREDRDS